MEIDQGRCVGCLECLDYCPMEAIKEDPAKGEVFIDQDECVECSCCLRGDICPVEAISQQELKWPRTLRAQFSEMGHPHPSTGGRGRGTQEMKTNDMTGRYPRGRIGIGIELGRPGTGTRFRDLEKVTTALALPGIEFEEGNPVYALFADPAKGKLKEEVLDEKVLSAIVEISTTPDQVPGILRILRQVAEQVDTVFSVGMASLLEPDGSCPAEAIVREAGFDICPNGKNNIGLGRPLAKL